VARTHNAYPDNSQAAFTLHAAVPSAGSHGALCLAHDAAFGFLFFFGGHSSGGHSQEPFLTFVGFFFVFDTSHHVFTFHLHYLNIQRCDFLCRDSFGKIYEF
jgi:hypothetical protein